MYVAKTKAMISFAATAKLICVFVFAYAKSRFSHDAAHMTFQMRFYRIQSLLILRKKLHCYHGRRHDDTCFRESDNTNVAITLFIT